MQRIERRKTKMEGRNTTFCTKALKKLDKSVTLCTRAKPVWNGGDKFQVTMTTGGHQIVVDLKNGKCACRKWQLTGIPCFHACACIFFKKEDPINYLHNCYKREVYLSVYNHILEPIIKTAPGRPKKNRNKKVDLTVEARSSDPTMLKRKNTSLKCGKCGQYGHNSRTCKKQKTDEDIEVEFGYEAEGVEPVNIKRTPKCHYCNEEGHNRRTCNSKVVDEMTKKKEALSKSKENGMINNKPAETGSANHGGITRPFKPPAKVGTLGIEAESFGKNDEKQFTSLRKLEAAKVQRQKKIGKQIQ